MPSFVKALYAETLQGLEGAWGFWGFARGAFFAWACSLSGIILLGLVLLPLLFMEHWVATLLILLVSLPAVAAIRYYAGARPAYALAERKSLGSPMVWGVGGFLMPWLVVGLASCFRPRS